MVLAFQIFVSERCLPEAKDFDVVCEFGCCEFINVCWLGKLSKKKKKKYGIFILGWLAGVLVGHFPY